MNMNIELEIIYHLIEPGECGPEGPAREEPRSGDLSSILYFQSLSYEKMYTYRYLSKQITKLDVPPKKSYYPLQGLIKVVPVVSVNSRTHLVLIFF